jgi:hypothetical protein
VKVAIEKVTPDLAKQYLQYNDGNRTTKKWWVESLALAITRGEWKITHQGLAFTKTGRLLDGQHRLQAIIQANKTVNILVSREVPEESFKVLDCGVKRTISDLTGMSVKTAEACRFIGSLLISGSNNVTAELALEVYNSGFGELHEELIQHCNKKAKVFASATIRAAAVSLALDSNNFNYIKKLYGNLVTQNFNELPPIAQVFIRQVNLNKIATNAKNDLLARALKVFDYKNAQMQTLRITDEEAKQSAVYCRNVIKKHKKEKTNGY